MVTKLPSIRSIVHSTTIRLRIQVIRVNGVRVQEALVVRGLGMLNLEILKQPRITKNHKNSIFRSPLLKKKKN